jgi:putative aldouronate transport system substrate-binding protein
MFRKAFATSLAFILSVGIMCGCSNSNSPSQSAASSAKPSTGGTSGQGQFTPSYPIVDEKINVKGALIGDSINISQPRLVWQKLEELTNIHVDWETVSKDGMAVLLASNNWPDFFHRVSDPIDNTYINDYGVIGGRFVNYQDYLQYMPNLKQAFQDYPDAEKVVKETNGGIYQLPYIGKDCTAVVARMYYREDTLKAVGCKVPTTVDEFHDVLVKLKDYNHGAAPLTEDREEFLWAPFGKGKNPDFEDDGTGKVVYNRVSDQYKLYLKYMNQLYSEGLLHKEYLTLDEATKLSLATKGLTVFGNDGLAGLAEDAFKSGKVELDQLAPLTSKYDGTQEVMGWRCSQPGSLMINSDCKYVKELCRMFDVMFATKEVAEGTGLDGTAFVYGPEGTTWKWSNSEHTEYEFILPKELEGKKAFGTYVYDSLIFWDLGRFDEFEKATTATEGNNKARQQGFVKNLVPYSEANPFPGDYLKFTKEEQEVIDNDYTTISNYIKEMKGKFITGIANVDTDWDDYVSKVNGMGLKEVLKAYQSAYNRWNA